MKAATTSSRDVLQNAAHAESLSAMRYLIDRFGLATIMTKMVDEKDDQEMDVLQLDSMSRPELAATCSDSEVALSESAIPADLVLTDLQLDNIAGLKILNCIINCS